jgi:hypothetical protein
LLHSGEKLLSDIKERTVAEGVRAQAAEGDTVIWAKKGGSERRRHDTKLYNEEGGSRFWPTPNTILVIKSQTMRMAEHVAYI